MEYLEFEEFVTNNCLESKCLLYKSQAKNCTKKSKQQRCYKKYLEKYEQARLGKFDSDENWDDVCSEVKTRANNTCQLWEILSREDKEYILENYYNDYKFLSSILDCAHIIPRSIDKSLYYDIENIVLISRYFHTLLDSYRHPVTRESISIEEREEWLKKSFQ